MRPKAGRHALSKGVEAPQYLPLIFSAPFVATEMSFLFHPIPMTDWTSRLTSMNINSRCVTQWRVRRLDACSRLQRIRPPAPKHWHMNHSCWLPSRAQCCRPSSDWMTIAPKLLEIKWLFRVEHTPAHYLSRCHITGGDGEFSLWLG